MANGTQSTYFYGPEFSSRESAPTGEGYRIHTFSNTIIIYIDLFPATNVLGVCLPIKYGANSVTSNSDGPSSFKQGFDAWNGTLH